MKCYIISSALILSAGAGFSQATANSVTMSKEFSQLASNSSGKALSANAFQSYSSGQIDGSQFFLPNWQEGQVDLNNKEVYNNGLLFIYDKVRQEIFFKKKDLPDVLLADKQNIKSFALKDAGKQYNFVNSSEFGITNPEVFYQILVDNASNDSSKLTLLKLTKTKLVKADKTDMMKQREGVVNDAFVDDDTYYIVKGAGALKQLPLKTKAVKKTMAELQVSSADKYLSEHTGTVNEEYLVDMVTQLNK